MLCKPRTGFPEDGFCLNGTATGTSSGQDDSRWWIWEGGVACVVPSIWLDRLVKYRTAQAATRHRRCWMSDDSWKDGLTPWQLLESAIRDKSDPGDPSDLQLAAEALAKGAEVNEEQDGWTPLMYAALQDDAAMAEWLISHGAKDDGRAVLEAARSNCPAALSVLLRDGAPTECDEHGDTPLILAAREGFYEVVSLLLAAGADAEHRDDSDTSARVYLQEAGREDLLPS